MRRFLSLVSVGAFVIPALCQGADAVAPLPAPLPAASGTTVPGSPAVRAAENSRPEPGGATEPEPKAVPQVSVPLRRSTESTDAPMGVGPSGQGVIDDEAARCSAKKTKKERAECRKSMVTQTKNPGAFER